jgi:hypothetical protein
MTRPKPEILLQFVDERIGDLPHSEKAVARQLAKISCPRSRLIRQLRFLHVKGPASLTLTEQSRNRKGKLLFHAIEIGCIVDAACPLVLGNSRISAQGPGSVRDVRGEVCW